MLKRQDGRYQEKLLINGKYRYFYGKTKAEVLKKIHSWEEEKEKGQFFNYIADLWWEEYEKQVEYNTTKGTKPAKERAKEYFYNRDSKSIEPHEIYSYLLSMSKTYADKTIKTQLSVFNMIFTFAVAKGYISFNPARDISAPAGTGKKTVHCPMEEEIEKVKKAQKSKAKLFAYIAMCAGLRKGEILALNKSDINLKERRIKINKSVYHDNNKPFLKKTKSKKSEGYAPIIDELYPMLKSLKNGLLFPNEKGELMSETQYQKFWEDFQKEIGITFTAHQLRHYYATALFENDIPPEEMQVLLRHAQLSTTMDIYKELREGKQEKIFKKTYSINI